EVDVAVVLVGVTAGEELLDHLDHLGDVPGGAGLHAGRQASEVREGAVEHPVDGIGYPPPRRALGNRPADYLVLDVGDVTAQQDVISAEFEPALQNIEVDLRPHLPGVRRGHDRRAAEINRHPAGNAR